VDPLRFGILGCGVIGKHHARMLADLPAGYAELIAVADIEEAPRAKLAAQHSCDASEPTALLERDDIDAVCVCTPSGSHAEGAVAALNAGKHVVVEKPIDVTLAAADRILAAQAGTGLQLTVISQHRFDLPSRIVHEAAAAGSFGRLTSGAAQVAWWRSQPYYDSGDWRGTWQLDGGGSLMNQSIHTIDLLLWMMGEAEEVFAYTRCLAHERIEVEDTAAAAVRFRNGALATVLGTTAAYPGLTARLHVHGERGSAVIDDDQLLYYHAARGEAVGDAYGASGAGNQAAEVLAGGGTSGQPGAGADPASLSEAHAAQLADFIDAVREGREPLVTGADGRRAVELILGIYESARTGKPVALGS
jgi:UDP-N-acetyl-2-amino-2-deoxyglucuronate dehydrogenase